MDRYNRARGELVSFVTPRLQARESVLTDVCMAVGSGLRIARLMPWTRRYGLVVTSDRAFLVERSRRRPHRPQEVARQAPRSVVAVTRCKERNNRAVLDLVWDGDAVRLSVYGLYALGVEIVEMALPPLPTTAKVSRGEAKRRRRGRARVEPSPPSVDPPREIVLEELPLHMRTDWRRTRPERQVSAPDIDLPREITRDDLPLHMRTDWRRKATEADQQDPN
jgi:hypothetical protein